MAAFGSMLSPASMPKLDLKSGSKRSLKVQKMKVQDVINMQEMMVQELQKTIQEFSQTVRQCAGVVQFREQLAVGMIQGFASLGVEKKYHVSADDMALAGFMHAQQLGSSERFMQSSMQQQQMLMSIPMIIQNPEQGCSLM